MRSRSRRGSKRSRPTSEQQEEVSLQSGHSLVADPEMEVKTEEIDCNISNNTANDIDTTTTTHIDEPIVRAIPIETTAVNDELVQEPLAAENPEKKTPANSEHASTEEDDCDTSPLTERSSSISEPIATTTSTAPVYDASKQGALTFEDLPEQNQPAPRRTPDRASAPASISSHILNGQLSDSSSLSELDDSEAETERLDISPHKNDFRTRSPTSTPVGSLIPSKRRFTITDGDSSATSIEERLNHLREDLEELTEELTPEGSVRSSSAGVIRKKRKRSDSMMDEDLSSEDESDKADSHDTEKDEDQIMKDESSPTDNENEDDEDQPVKQNLPTTPLRTPTMNGTRAKSQSRTPRSKNDKPDFSKDGLSNGTHGEGLVSLENAVVENEATAEAGEADHTREDDEDADAEIARLKKAAAEDMTSIEVLFAQLRDKLVEERVSEIDREIAMINDGTHPEFVLMARAVEERRDEKKKSADVLLRHLREAENRNLIGTKAAIHSQYHQNVRRIREDALGEANTMWFAIHRERRAADTNVNDFIYRIPKQLATQYRHRQAYNNEVSLLAGIAKYVGFPSAPEIHGASADDTRADLEAMGLIARLPHAPPPAPVNAVPAVPEPNNPLLPPSQFAKSIATPIQIHQNHRTSFPSRLGPSISIDTIAMSSLESSFLDASRPRTPPSPLLAPTPIAPPPRQHAYRSHPQSPIQTQPTTSSAPMQARQLDRIASALDNQPSRSQPLHHTPFAQYQHQSQSEPRLPSAALTYGPAKEDYASKHKPQQPHSGQTSLSLHQENSKKPFSSRIHEDAQGEPAVQSVWRTQVDAPGERIPPKYSSITREEPASFNSNDARMIEEIRAGGASYASGARRF